MHILIRNMDIRWTLLVPLVVLLGAKFVTHAAQVGPDDKTIEFVIRMPNVHPDEPDSYMETTKRLPANGTYYIVAFEPLADMGTVHHLILSGCQSASDSKRGQCQGESAIMYAWARNAPKLNLPKGVGFKLGKGTVFDYIHIQVHYSNIDSIPASGDTSGVRLHLSTEKQPKIAGVYLIATGGRILPKTTEYYEAACEYTEDIKMHPFAYRTHAHTRGKLVSGYRVHRSNNRLDWTLIGQKDPLLPEGFYPVGDNSIVIQKGDYLAGRCKMHNNENRTIYVGGTHNDEMCNFYMMYYVDSDKLPETTGCGGEGPPNYYWITDKIFAKSPVPPYQ